MPIRTDERQTQEMLHAHSQDPREIFFEKPTSADKPPKIREPEIELGVHLPELNVDRVVELYKDPHTTERTREWQDEIRILIAFEVIMETVPAELQSALHRAKEERRLATADNEIGITPIVAAQISVDVQDHVTGHLDHLLETWEGGKETGIKKALEIYTAMRLSLAEQSDADELTLAALDRIIARSLAQRVLKPPFWEQVEQWGCEKAAREIEEDLLTTPTETSEMQSYLKNLWEKMDSMISQYHTNAAREAITIKNTNEEEIIPKDKKQAFVARLTRKFFEGK